MSKEIASITVILCDRVWTREREREREKLLTESPLAYDTAISASTTRCVRAIHDGALVTIAPDIAVYGRTTAWTELSLTNSTCICGGRENDAYI